MRVLHIHKVAGVSGSERHLLTLLPALQERGVEVQLCVLAAPGADMFVAAATRAGISTSVLAAGRDVNPRLFVTLGRRVRAFRPQLVHTHLIHGDLYGLFAARVVGVAGISTVHSTIRVYHAEPSRTAARLAGRLARRTIAISEHVARMLKRERIAPWERIRVIHYGTDVSAWKVSEADRERTRGQLGVPAGDVVLGVASRLVAGKGHDVLLRSFHQTLRTVPKQQLLVAADGPLRHELEETALRLGCGARVRFLGFVENIKAFMSACDVFVFPSLPTFGEGFGLAALEAMAAGRPLVATAVDSLPEIVVDGRTGLLVRPYDVEEMAAALTKLAREPQLRQRLGWQGRKRASERFTVDRMADATTAVYEEALRATATTAM